MKNARHWFTTWRRRFMGLLGALTVVSVSYLMASALHREALAQLDAAKGYIARSDWENAVQCLDAALRKDRYVSTEVYLLRGRALNNALHTTGWLPAGHTRKDTLADIDRFLQSHPNSGEAYYQRRVALSALGK